MNKTVTSIHNRAEEIADLVLQGKYEEANQSFTTSLKSDKELGRMTKYLSLATVKKRNAWRYSDFLHKICGNGLNFEIDSLRAS